MDVIRFIWSVNMRITLSLLALPILLSVSTPVVAVHKTHPAQFVAASQNAEQHEFSLEVALSTEQPLLLILLFAFLAGVLVSFTPCIYPMIPITVGILQAQATASAWRNFFLALFYVLGMASVYAVLGYVVATTSLIFGQWFASPWFIALAVAFFLYFAFAMFGFYDIYVPAFLRTRGTVSVRGSLLYSFVFGALSGTVTSPCLTPALAVVLGYVAKLGRPVTGFLTLFSFSCGMGVLLVIIGTFSGVLNVLPRAGSWMVAVKKFFGFLMLGVGIYIMQPLLTHWAIPALYGSLMMTAALYYALTIKCLICPGKHS